MKKKKVGEETLLGPGIARHEKSVQKKFAILVVLQGKEMGREYRIRRREYNLGRDPEAEISLSGDPRISRFHARLKVEFHHEIGASAFLLEDLDSTNHTYVNEEEIESCELRDGDKIQIGDTLLRFDLQDEIDAKFSREIQKRLNYDSLTGLLTRPSFELALEYEITRCQKYKQTLALLMMDLDNLKPINDRHGHLAGSYVLGELGLVIKDNLRGTDMAGKYGGDEFVALLAEVDKDVALMVAERLRKFIREHEFVFRGHRLPISISIGISTYPEDGANFETLVFHADKALYEAKKRGRDQVVLYDAEAAPEASPPAKE